MGNMRLLCCFMLAAAVVSGEGMTESKPAVTTLKEGGVNLDTATRRSCAVCIKVVTDVLARVTKNKLKAQAKELLEKKLKKKALKKANKTKPSKKNSKKQKASRLKALQDAADKFWASKPMSPKQEAKEIVEEIKLYCQDPTTLKLEKAECQEYIQPLSSTLAQPLSRGVPIDALGLCQRMHKRNKSVCGKLKFKTAKVGVNAG